jgi:alkanesulfonate monooxygenase SsuD/methylene tetrahydromethanopterin reductase-like flavin-dependent oxidoreductase (luciferase family)
MTDHTPKTDQSEPARRAAKADLLSRARHQLAAVTEEFQHGLSKVKDPGVRRRLTASCIDLLQNYLGKAQIKLTHYRGKLQLQADPDETAPPAEPGKPAAGR